MRYPRVLSEADVAKLLDLGMTDRARAIDTYVRFVDGTIYDGRPAFEDDASGKPLSERRPCVISAGVKNAIKSLGDMVFGEGGFPAVTSAPNEDDKEFEGDDGLSEDESATLDHFARKVVEQARLRAVAKQILSKSMAAGCVAVLCSLRAGRLRVSTIDGKNCTPEFDDEDPRRVRKLTVSYRFVRKERDAEGQEKPHVYQYRRVIDEQSDVTFKPVEVTRETEFPTPSAPAEKIAHGLGFCPVIWYAFDREESDDAAPDGHPIHEGQLTLVDAINQALSQRHRAAIYCGDPQVIETGVEDEDVRAPMGTAEAGAERRNDVSGWGVLNGKNAWRGTRNAVRKKGAGTVWRYTSDTAKVSLLTLAGDALQCLDEDAEDLKSELREALRIVHIDAEKLTGSGDVSGKTLAFVFGMQVTAANTVREACWTDCFLPVLGMLFRIVLKTKKGLYLPAAKKAAALLERYEREVESATGGVAWFDPPLRPVWPEYFPLTATDEQAVVTTVTTAGDLVSPETKLTKLRQVFPDIQDPVAYAEERAKAREEEQKKQQALAVEQMKALHGPPGDDAAADAGPGANGPGAPAKKPPAGGASGPAASKPRAPGAKRPKGGAKAAAPAR